MNELPPSPGIPPTDWDATPVSVQVLVRSLIQQVSTLTTQVTTLTTQVATLTAEGTALRARVQELEARLKQTSRNSSKPPSSDPPDAPLRPPKTPRGRQAGGQPGHPGTTRELAPPDQVQEIVPVYPDVCPACQHVLTPELPDARPVLRTQVWELPVVTPTVTEYQHHTVCCPHCHTLVRDDQRPADAPPGDWGPRATATVGLLRGAYHQSERIVQAILSDLCGMPISLGSIATSCVRVSAALGPIDQAIQQVVQAHPVVNVDETSWRTPARGWLWVATSAVATCFRITASRGRASRILLLGATYAGVVGSDRWSAYNDLDLAQRQLCWSHIQRNLLALAEYGAPDSPWAAALVPHVTALFAAWHAFRDGRTERAGLQAALVPIQAALQDAFRDGQTRSWHRVVGFSTDLLARWDALWTFASVAGVEPTNNAAERALRPAVIWRKLSGGTKSADGSRFVERILSVVTTCRQQGRPILAFLTDAMLADWSGRSTPTLVAIPSPT